MKSSQSKQITWSARKKIFALTWASIHFTIVVMACLHFEVDGNNLPGIISGLYARLSYTNSGFSFYAPSVGAPVRAHFTIQTADDTIVTAKLTDDMGFSASRVNTMIAWFWLTAKDSNLKRSLTASWASHMFARYPGAKKVTVDIEVGDLPDMKTYQTGARMVWRSAYQVEFTQEDRQS